MRSCIRKAAQKLCEEVVEVAPFADERAWDASLEAAMADFGACPSVPMPVIEALLGASSERRPMTLLLPACHAALGEPHGPAARSRRSYRPTRPT